MTTTDFEPLVVNHVELLFGQVRTVDMPLQVGATAESVQVTATAEYLNRDNAEVDGVVESPRSARFRSTFER